MEKPKCHDCGAEEGQLHEYGCDMERCPYCLGQLITCGCIYRILGIDCAPGTRVYSEGPSDEQRNLWIAVLNKKGRIPYLRIPVLCAMCGGVWPDFFHSDDWKKFVPPNLQDAVLCRACFKRLQELMPEGWQKLAIREEDRVESLDFALRLTLGGGASFFCPVEHRHYGYAANGLYYQAGKITCPPERKPQYYRNGLTEPEHMLLYGLAGGPLPLELGRQEAFFSLQEKGLAKLDGEGEGEHHADRSFFWVLTEKARELLRKDSLGE
jgi:hypothetical protein